MVRFGHMDLYFLNLGDFADLSIGKVLYFIQGVGLLIAKAKGCAKDRK